MSGDDVLSAPMVLVVDDDLALRETLANVLRDERYVVATAADGRQALDLLEGGFRPAAILLDLWMPHIDGREALALFKSDDRLADIPIIVVTADTGAKDDPLLARADRLLMKPVDLDNLLTQLADACRRFAWRYRNETTT